MFRSGRMNSLGYVLKPFGCVLKRLKQIIAGMCYS